MEFKICNNIGKCKALWNIFSQNKRLFDIWDFRVCFYDSDDNEPYFIAGYKGHQLQGIVPLQFVKSKKQYTYFGGWFPERNSFFLKDKTKLSEFMEQCPSNTFIEGIEPSEGNFFNFVDDEYTYYLDLSKYNSSFESYFGSLDKKKQKNLKRDIKSIPKYQIYYNRIGDFDRLVELNIRQYEEDSKFHNEAIRKGLNKMIGEANKKKILEMMSLEVSGKIEAVDIGIAFGDWYYAIIGGSNNQKIPNLGKLMTALDIQNAISKKARFVDFFATSGHWKNMWNFNKEMLLKFMK